MYRVVSVLHYRRNQLRSVAVHLLFTSLPFGVSFGVVAAIVTISHEIHFPLPASVRDQTYVSVGRQNGLGQFNAVSLYDISRIGQIAPDLSWFHAEPLHGLRLRHADGATHPLQATAVSGDYFQHLGITPATGTLAPPGGTGPAAVISDALSQSLGTGGGLPPALLLVSETDVTVPVIGVVNSEFTGLFGNPVDAWIFDTPKALKQYVQALPTNDEMSERWPAKRLFGVRPAHIPISALQTLFDQYRFENSPLKVESPRSGYSMNIKLPGTAGDRLKVAEGIEIHPEKREQVIQRLTWLGALVFLLSSLAYISLVESLAARHSARRNEWRIRVAVGARPAHIFAEAVPQTAIALFIVGGIASLASGYFINVLMGFEPFSSYLDVETVRKQSIGLIVGLALLTSVFLLATAHVSRVTSRISCVVPPTGLQDEGVATATRQALLLAATCGLYFAFCLGNRYFEDSRIGLSFTNKDVLVVSFGPDHWSPMGVLPGQPDFRGAIMGVPEVKSAARTTVIPLSGDPWAEHQRILVKGNSTWADLPLYVNPVSPDYFSTLGISLVAGRTFDPVSDSEIVLSKSAAQQLGGDIRQSLGRVITFGTGPKSTNPRAGGRSAMGPVKVVVGIAEDIPYVNFLSDSDHVAYVNVSAGFGHENWMINHDGGAENVLHSLQRNAALTGWQIQSRGTPASLLRHQFLAKRSVEVLLTGAAVFVLLMAFTGIAAAFARSLDQGKQAVGVRFALGATSWSILGRRFIVLKGDLASVLLMSGLLVLAGKLFSSAFAELFEYWLLVPVSVSLLTLCVITDLVILRRFERQISIRALVMG